MTVERASLTERQVAAILQLRRARAEIFGAELFTDPAWDVLLELFAAKLAGRKLKLVDLEIFGPRSTLVRWAAVLEERGLVSCQLDGSEMRKLSLEITPLGAAKMSKLLRNLPGLLAPA